MSKITEYIGSFPTPWQPRPIVLDAAYRFDGTGFSGVTSITYNTSLTTSVTGPVLRYLNVNEEAMGAAVPLPAGAME